MKFNAEAGSYPFTASSQYEFDSTLCDPNRFAVNYVPSYLSRTSVYAPIGGVAAILINGVTFFDSSSAEKVDPYAPNEWEDSGTV